MLGNKALLVFHECFFFSEHVLGVCCVLCEALRLLMNTVKSLFFWSYILLGEMIICKSLNEKNVWDKYASK